MIFSLLLQSDITKEIIYACIDDSDVKLGELFLFKSILVKLFEKINVYKEIMRRSQIWN